MFGPRMLLISIQNATSNHRYATHTLPALHISPSRAYLQSLEKQLSHLRLELTQAYRSRSLSQSAQLDLTSTLRKREDALTQLSAQAASLDLSLSKSTQKNREWEERYKARESDVQHLQDEMLALHLEVEQLMQRNRALEGDNASLLQRWLDRMNERVDWMNSDFEKERGKLSSIEPTVEVEDSVGNEQTNRSSGSKEKGKK